MWAIFKKLSDLLARTSFGQYQTKLYHNGRSTESSPWAGLLSLTATLALSVYAFIVLFSIFTGNHLNMEITERDMCAIWTRMGVGYTDKIYPEKDCEYITQEKFIENYIEDLLFLVY